MTLAGVSRFGNPTDAPLAALLVVRFDKKRGNIVTWRRAIAGLELDAAVEYKALPSGLHAVDKDLVYFIQGQFAGLSAFENAPASEAERNASFASVVVLVRLDGSRLGKVWTHAEKIQELASLVRQDIFQDEGFREENLIDGVGETPGKAAAALDDFWNKSRIKEGEAAPDASGKSPLQQRQNSHGSRKRRSRGITMSSDPPAHSSHPAQSIKELLDAFGPLIFPLYRAALLRKRILIIARPPMQKFCDFVYLLSVLSAVPNAISEALPDTLGLLKPLFSVGIYDIPYLEKLTEAPSKDQPVTDGSYDSEETGWIACTSDELLTTKGNLYDVKVEFPRSTALPPDETNWPTITRTGSSKILATQRDLRRYKTVCSGLGPFEGAQETIESHGPAMEDEQVALLADEQKRPSTANNISYENTIVEPMSWAAVAYDSFVWWASAGERSSDLEEEEQHDYEFLDTALDSNMRPDSPVMRRHSQSFADGILSQEAYELTVVTYFHRLTDLIFSIILDAVDDTSSEAQPEPDQKKRLTITKEDLSRMGLDVWSSADRTFVQELSASYLKAEAEVQGASVECCGVRFY